MSGMLAERSAHAPEGSAGRVRIALGSAVVILTLLVTLATTAVPGSNTRTAGSDPGSPTVLDYSEQHDAFVLRVRIWRPTNTAGPFMSDRYAIAFYDDRSRLVWRASGLRSRSFAVGSEVSRVVITRDDDFGPITRWQQN